ncbi:MAG: hypothetical protein R3C56_21220 [Pirellulaceae bacterium]
MAIRWLERNGKGGIYFYNDYRSNTPWGDTRPDYGRGEVRSYIRDNAMMWLQDYHVDGLRLDMTLYIRSVDASGQQEIPEGWGLTQWVNREIHAFKPSAITIAEDLQNNAYLTKSDNEGGPVSPANGMQSSSIRSAMSSLNPMMRAAI